MAQEYFEEFQPPQSGASESILKQIVFLRERYHRQCGKMTEDCFESFVKLMEKQWTDFSVVYRAAQRNSEYLGLLKTLTQPYHQGVCQKWEVHWRIGLWGNTTVKAAYELDEYRLMVECIREY
jgi:hypothetical protein